MKKEMNMNKKKLDFYCIYGFEYTHFGEHL